MNRVKSPVFISVLAKAALFICVCVVSVGTCASAENPGRRPQEFWNIQLENDAFSFSQSDRYYTGGFQVSHLTTNKSISWQQELIGWITGDDAFIVSAVEYAIGQAIFNPADISLQYPNPNDRPYAGWLYGTAATSFLLDQTPRLDTFQFVEFTLGIVGPSSRADDLQTGLHDILEVTDPQGWDSQLKDEPGIGLALSRKWRIKFKPDAGIQNDMSPHLVMSLGNVYTYLGGGVMLRIGKNLHTDIGPPNIRPGFPGSSAFFSLEQNTTWYFFIGHESRLVFRNIFLDGNTLRDSPSVEKEFYVSDYQFGFVYRYNSVRFAFSNIYRSKEFEGQEDSTSYGAISISYFL